MIYSFSSQGGYHEICHQVAKRVKIPVPYICYRMFKILYRLNQKQALVFFVESELTGFLISKHGKFILRQEGDEETVSFNDGYTIGPAPNAERWEEFFRLCYIQCRPETRNMIDRMLQDQLRKGQSDKNELTSTPMHKEV